MKTVFNRRTVLIAAALGASTTLLQACGGGDDEPQHTIVEVAQKTPDLSILVEAVVAAWQQGRACQCARGQAHHPGGRRVLQG